MSDEHDETIEEYAPDSDAEDRAAILKRRAVFIASAIAGLTLASCDGNPQPCLDVATTGGSAGSAGSSGSGGMGGEPQPCLSMPIGGEAGAGGTAGSGGMGGAGGS